LQLEADVVQMRKPIVWAGNTQPMLKDIPSFAAFTEVAPGERFNAFAIFATPAFDFAIVFNERTSSFDHARRTSVFFFIIAPNCWSGFVSRHIYYATRRISCASINPLTDISEQYRHASRGLYFNRFERRRYCYAQQDNGTGMRVLSYQYGVKPLTAT
jgi:hypothetical protein